MKDTNGVESDEGGAPSSPNPEFQGIFITDGAELTLHGFEIRITGSRVEASDLRATLRQDLCRHWLSLALEHLGAAGVANRDMLAAASRNENESLARSLESEFRSSMQAIVASAIGMDAFYTGVASRIPIPDDQRRAWQKNRTAHWRRMGEVFRVAFLLRQDKARELRKILQQIDKYRNWAVHPPAEQKEPVLHREIGRGVEWRFVAFRYSNALAVVRMTLSMVTALTGQPRPHSEQLRQYCEGLAKATGVLGEVWAERYPDLPIR